MFNGMPAPGATPGIGQSMPAGNFSWGGISPAAGAKAAVLNPNPVSNVQGPQVASASTNGIQQAFSKMASMLNGALLRRQKDPDLKHETPRSGSERSSDPHETKIACVGLARSTVDLLRSRSAYSLLAVQPEVSGTGSTKQSSDKVAPSANPYSGGLTEKQAILGGLVGSAYGAMTAPKGHTGESVGRGFMGGMGANAGALLGGAGAYTLANNFNRSLNISPQDNQGKLVSLLAGLAGAGVGAYGGANTALSFVPKSKAYAKATKSTGDEDSEEPVGNNGIKYDLAAKTASADIRGNKGRSKHSTINLHTKKASNMRTNQDPVAITLQCLGALAYKSAADAAPVAKPKGLVSDSVARTANTIGGGLLGALGGGTAAEMMSSDVLNSARLQPHIPGSMGRPHQKVLSQVLGSLEGTAFPHVQKARSRNAVIGALFGALGGGALMGNVNATAYPQAPKTAKAPAAPKQASDEILMQRLGAQAYKQSSQDNSMPSKSALGDPNGLNVSHRKDDYAKGEQALKSLNRFSRSEVKRNYRFARKAMLQE